MKIFSISQLAHDLVSALKRFPLFIIFCVTITVSGIVTIEYEKDFSWEVKLQLYHFMSVLSMGIVASLAASNLAEKLHKPLKWSLIVQAILLLLMLGYYLISPTQFSSFELAMRIFVINLGLSMLLLWLPYAADNNLNAFWLYGKTLFIRFFTTYLFTMILYGGLSLALLALDVLFGVEFDGIMYLHLYIVLGGIFAPLFFAAGLKSDYSLYAEAVTYPKALRFLVLYILLPLVVLYMLILYVYAGKIILLWQFPSGWVSNLVLSFSIAGLVSFFLIYPLRDSGNRFLSTFFRFYFWLMLPLITLLFVAIFKRIGAYGITELRYYVMILAFWLAYISVYFILTRYRNLKMIPLSFCIVAILSTFGPWGAFSVSKNSQLSRFEHILTENNMLNDGKVIHAPDTISRKAQINISSIVSYISEYHDIKTFQPYFETDFDSLFKGEDYRYNKESLLMELMGLKYISRWDYRLDEETGEETESVVFRVDAEEQIMSVSGFDHLINISSYYYTYGNDNFDSLDVRTYRNNQGFVLTEKANLKNHKTLFVLDGEKDDLFTIDFESLARKLLRDFPLNNDSRYLDAERLTLKQTLTHYDVEFRISSLSFDLTQDKKFSYMSVNGVLLIKEK